MVPRLSICIPSYNRGKFLPDLLQSIASQYDERVEVVICDNGSQDNTPQLVRLWQKEHPWIVYDRLEENIGPDRCFLRSIELAKGDFCWLMGDDDIVEPGGIAKVLSSLQDELTGITVNRLAYDRDLKRSWKEDSRSLQQDVVFREFHACCASLMPLFGFLSAQIVRRIYWLEAAKDPELNRYFHAYVLIYIIGKMIQARPRWLYIHQPCVGWRSGNDSFAKELGRYGRFALDVQAYTDIAQGLFSGKWKRRILADITKKHLIGHVRDLKFQRHPVGWRGFGLCLPKLYFVPSFWFRLTPALIVPYCILVVFRPLYRMMRRVKPDFSTIGDI